MSLLNKVTSGAKDTAQFYIVYGTPGVGKSTFASQFPSPLFLDLEDGSKHLNVTRIAQDLIPNFDSLIGVLKEISENKTEYKTLIIDSVTALEKLIEAAVCAEHKVNTLSDVPWGGGPVAVQNKLNTMINLLKDIQSKMQINIIIIAHSQVKGFIDPTHNQSYDRHILQCNQKVGQLLTSAADHVFYCAYSIDFSKDKRTQKVQAFSTGDRVIYTSWRAGHEAKTRYEGIPYEISMSYQALIKAKDESKPKDASLVLEEINALLAKADELTVQRVKAAIADAANDSVKLNRIKQKLQTIIEA